WLRRESGAQHPGSSGRFECGVNGALTDFLLFETDERGPDDRLRYQFEAISRIQMEEQEL
ncbi:hypothetical protein V2K16_26780, partial [Pseudomonas alliivorans]|uniref:hypothetical protein n=1 Tax=Pseudomonas alliivorans TaxID=2810613 RepID=UPI001AE96800